MPRRLRLSTRYSVNTGILIALVVGIVIIIEILSYRHNWRKDFTENKRHSLADQTISVLQDLSTPVEVTVFIPKGTPAYEEAKRLFALYEYESEMLTVNMVDPDLEPGMALEYDIRRYGVPVVFLEGERGRETITTVDEEQTTNALIKVTRGEKKSIYFLSGHGEPALDDTEMGGLSIAKKMLQDKNYDPQTLVLMRAEAVPEDCAVLVVCGPQTDITEPELEAIERYIDRRGRILFLIDPETVSSLKSLLEKYGLVLGDDMVVDRLSRLFGGDYLTPVLTTYSSNHAITRNFSLASFFPVARSVSTTDTPSVRTTWLAKTGEGSWAESNIEDLKKGIASFDPDTDRPGPVTLAAVSEIEAREDEAEESGNSKHAAVAVFGDSDFATNARITLSGNSDMFVNTVNWLGEEETLIAIRPRDPKFSPIILTPVEARMVLFLPVIALPGIVLIAGIYVFMRRSRHP